MHFLNVFFVLTAALTQGLAIGGFPLAKLENLITFGDSYTDEGRLVYMFDHHTFPPQGEMLPISNQTSSGGYCWPRYVANETGATLYDYAVGGAMCSNEIISRRLDAINGSFPSLMEYEVPTFKTDLSYPKLYPNRRHDNTVYSLWIGTNDLGVDGFLRSRQSNEATISTFVNCIWSFFDQIYATGARNFVLMNEAPLNRAPMFAPASEGGTGNNQYWGNKTAYDVPEYQDKIYQFTTSVNTMFDYGLPFELVEKKRWPGATFAIFDTHQLVLDVRTSPEKYLDQPANVTGSWHTCFQGCQQSEEPQSNFIW